MPYNGKTDWKLNDTVYPEDMNRIEGQIGKNTSEIEGVSGKIGNPSDGEEQLTLFGKLAAIIAKLLGIETKMDTANTNINNKIGTESDADTQPTLFGRLAQLKKVLLEKLAELLTKVTGIDGKIGTSGDTAGTATLFGQVKDISEKMPTGIIKSVQEILIKRQTGLIKGPDDLVNGTPYFYDFSIGKVDASKTIVLTTNYARLGDTGVYRSIARIIENGNKLRVYSTDTNGTEIENTMIQIIEYM